MAGEHVNQASIAAFQNWLSSIDKLIFIVLGVASMAPIMSLIQGHGIRSLDIYVTGVLILVTLVAWIWHQLRRNSLMALFSYSYVSLTSLFLGFLWGIPQILSTTKLAWLIDNYLALYIFVFTTILVILPWVFIKRWGYLSEMFEDFRAHLPAGTISVERLWWWMSFKGESNRWPKNRIAAWIGFVTTMSLAIGIFGGRNAFGYFLFLVFLVMTPSVTAVFLARIWLQWRYLGWHDLEIQY